MPGTCDPCPGNKNATLITISILFPCESRSAVRESAHSEPREAARYLPFEVLQSNVRCCLFDWTCSLLMRREFSGYDCCPLSAGLASYIVMTREARLVFQKTPAVSGGGINVPAV